MFFDTQFAQEFTSHASIFTGNGVDCLERFNGARVISPKLPIAAATRVS